MSGLYRDVVAFNTLDAERRFYFGDEQSIVRRNGIESIPANNAALQRRI
jgi:hypothetical protein